MYTVYSWLLSVQCHSEVIQCIFDFRHQTWPDSECSHTVQCLDCSDLNWRWQSLSPVLAWYDPFGVDVPSNFDNTHTQLHNCLTSGHMAVRYKPKLFLSGKWPSRIQKPLCLLLDVQFRIERFVHEIAKVWSNNSNRSWLMTLKHCCLMLCYSGVL